MRKHVDNRSYTGLYNTTLVIIVYITHKCSIITIVYYVIVLKKLEVYQLTKG